jgi:hypothetical protein
MGIEASSLVSQRYWSLYVAVAAAIAVLLSFGLLHLLHSCSGSLCHPVMKEEQRFGANKMLSVHSLVGPATLSIC